MIGLFGRQWELFKIYINNIIIAFLKFLYENSGQNIQPRFTVHRLEKKIKKGEKISVA
jgi:hypothetical protein